MSLHELIESELNATEEFLERSTRVLEEQHSSFAPASGIYTVAQHMAHIAKSIDWFVNGMVSSSGFSMDFEAQEREVRAIASLTVARTKIAEAFANARALLAKRSIEELEAHFPEGAVMHGPKWAALFGLVEHTAHHRGALTLYSRLLGLSPKMPYMEL